MEQSMRTSTASLIAAGMKDGQDLENAAPYPNYALFGTPLEKMYREALVHLFDGITQIEDVVYVLKMREVYRHLSNAADRGDEAANVIGDIVVKMT